MTFRYLPVHHSFSLMKRVDYDSNSFFPRELRIDNSSNSGSCSHPSSAVAVKCQCGRRWVFASRNIRRMRYAEMLRCRNCSVGPTECASEWLTWKTCALRDALEQKQLLQQWANKQHKSDTALSVWRWQFTRALHSVALLLFRHWNSVISCFAHVDIRQKNQIQMRPLIL